MSVAAVFVIAVAVAGNGQSLADAASRAEEQRRQTSAPSRVLTNDSLPGEWAITTGGLEQYASARAGIASIRRQHAEVHQRLWNASMEAQTLGALAPALSSEPLVRAVLDQYGLTPREYLKREQAVMNAAEWAFRPDPPDFDEYSTRWANILYLRNSRQAFSELQRRYRDIEKGDIWWAAWRFVQ